ncbi:MAG TPA: GNAT family N-acetyltransferase [Pyrinomonadaceae bacterium]|nr:GNAT family N-acetyltransferase [Pyrinomonadaceae bacterium]
MNFQIETDRLLLRPLTPDDLPWFLRVRAKEEVSRYLGGASMQTPEFIEARHGVYLECYREHGFGMAAVVEKSSGEMIGWGGLQPLEYGWNGEHSERAGKDVEVGYGFDTPYWGKGYATELAAAWLRYGFEQLKLPRIIAIASPENKSSWHVMEKLGMKYETTEPHYGSPCVFYAISRDDFKPRDSFYVLHNSDGARGESK